jgi:Protein of unknown function (DUF3306)
MSKRESFLARWSRRKQAAVAEPAETESGAVPILSEKQIEGKETTEGAAAAAGLHKDGVAPPARGTDATATFLDPASLPPIESIAADTDIRAFLAPGVSPELARTALRRAWAADPKIRDFVGLADYDWDFNAPGSMAGFGPLEMTEELREIADRIMGPPPVESAAGPTESSDLSGQESSRSENTELIHDTSAREADAGDPRPKLDPPGCRSAKNRPDAAKKSQLVVRQRHGGALPK